MSLTANSAINPNVTLNELEGYLKTKYDTVEIKNIIRYTEYESGLIIMNNDDSIENIAINFFYDKTPIEDRDEEESAIVGQEIVVDYLYLSSYGIHSQEYIDLLRDICEEFGGALSEEDSEGCNYKWINREKFFQKRYTFEEYLSEMLSPESMEILRESANKFNIKLF